MMAFPFNESSSAAIFMPMISRFRRRLSTSSTTGSLLMILSILFFSCSTCSAEYWLLMRCSACTSLVEWLASAANSSISRSIGLDFAASDSSVLWCEASHLGEPALLADGLRSELKVRSDHAAEVVHQRSEGVFLLEQVFVEVEANSVESGLDLVLQAVDEGVDLVSR